MEFGPFPVSNALGAILAHSIRVPSRRIKKGHILDNKDISDLHLAGIESVTACRLSPDDLHEDEAATRLAKAVTGDGLTASLAHTGRVNLIAQQEGLLHYTPEALLNLNSVDEGITLAALPPFIRVARRQMVATVKIIPFGVPARAMERALPKTPILRVAAFKPGSMGLIQTLLDDTKPSLLDKTEAVMSMRAQAIAARLEATMRCRHDPVALSECINALLKKGLDHITIVGASAIVDRRDVIPLAIEACGGGVHHFGMPVDPGNLLLSGSVGHIPIIGAPGCARSPKPNGYDRVLERIAARLPITSREIMGMGMGGVLKEIPSRPLPRAEAQHIPHPVRQQPRIHGLLLAAGQSRRMGQENKLLTLLNGKPMVRHAAETLLAANLENSVIITGHESHNVSQALDGLKVTHVTCPSYALGLSETIKRGISSLPEGVDAILIALGDMPRLSVTTINRLISAFDPHQGRSICVPVYQGKRGTPVLFSSRFFPEILELSGDAGAKSLLHDYREFVAEIPVDDPGIHLDIDTPDELETERRKG